MTERPTDPNAAADEVIAHMEQTRIMTPVTKDDAWTLVAEIRRLRTALAVRDQGDRPDAMPASERKRWSAEMGGEEGCIAGCYLGCPHTPHPVESCPACGDDAELGAPSAKPGDVDFGEYDCSSCGFQFGGPTVCRRCGVAVDDHTEERHNERLNALDTHRDQGDRPDTARLRQMFHPNDPTGVFLHDVTDWIEAHRDTGPEQVRALAERWRSPLPEGGDRSDRVVMRATLNFCADDLDAALAALPATGDGPGEVVEDDRYDELMAYAQAMQAESHRLLGWLGGLIEDLHDHADGNVGDGCWTLHDKWAARLMDYGPGRKAPTPPPATGDRTEPGDPIEAVRTLGELPAALSDLVEGFTAPRPSAPATTTEPGDQR